MINAELQLEDLDARSVSTLVKGEWGIRIL